MEFFRFGLNLCAGCIKSCCIMMFGSIPSIDYPDILDLLCCKKIPCVDVTGSLAVLTYQVQNSVRLSSL